MLSFILLSPLASSSCFFFNDTATTEIYTLSLHDALPIYSTTTGTGGVQTLNVSGSGRYVRMYGTQRATQWGYSLWEFIIHTVGAPPTTTTTPPAGSCPWVKSTAPVADRVNQLMAAMTNAQKVVVLHGNGATGP